MRQAQKRFVHVQPPAIKLTPHASSLASLKKNGRVHKSMNAQDFNNAVAQQKSELARQIPRFIVPTVTEPTIQAQSDLNE